MAELNKMLDTLKDRTEEAFKCYAEKENWEPQDLKCAKEAAELYDKLQTIQMNTGIWEGMQEDMYSGARSRGSSYGESYMRGRGADGRYMSRGYGMDDGYAYGNEGSMRGGSSRGGSYAQGGQGGSYGQGGGSSRGGYSEGRSMHSVKDQAIQRLEALIDTAESDYERQEIMKMIETIEKQKR